MFRSTTKPRARHDLSRKHGNYEPNLPAWPTVNHGGPGADTIHLADFTNAPREPPVEVPLANPLLNLRANEVHDSRINAQTGTANGLAKQVLVTESSITAAIHAQL